MARQPEVFVKPLEPEQAQRLVKIARTSSDRVRLRRAGVVLASVQGRSVPEIAEMFAATEGYVREVIHAFNDTGFAALDPKWSGGRARKFGPAAREIICQTARSSPSALGQPFTTWSLTKLADYLATHCRLPVSTETIRRVLREAGIRWQATKTWKASRDPDFAAKMNRILDLYDNPPADGRVICVDEFGPLNLIPRPGRGWCAAHDIELVFAPSNASWLNWIECEFTALRYFTLDGSDYPSHAAQETAIARYIRWANRRATPKRHYAVNSKIRRPDYLPNVA